MIRFDPQHGWFWARQNEEDDFRHLRQVAYVATRVPQYLIELKGTDALYSKGIEWEHEKEWRIIRNFNDAKQKWDRINTAKTFYCSRFLRTVSAAS